MSAPAQVIATIGLTSDSQSDDAWLHALLTTMDGTPEATFQNPFTEAIYLLRNINPQALAKVKAMLSAGENRYAAGCR